jgi:hypothetical protein
MPNIDLRDHPQIFQDREQRIWVVSQSTYGIVGASTDQVQAAKIPEIKGDMSVLPITVQGVTLHSPSLQPIYGGSTLLEALWAEMDRLMEGLMTGTDAEDEGDKYRAQELAWVIAIVTNAYVPSVDLVRVEAMRRWNEQQAEADLVTKSEEQQHKFDAAGVDGYEL